MDALYPRLLVTRFAACFRFYDAVLPDLVGATLARGDERGPYASWDVRAETAVALFDRAAMAAAIGADGRSAEGDAVVLTSRVPDVDAAFRLCLAHGAREVAAPTARPEWGPTARTAHVRDPEGNLLELQSY
ncbi:VOC family protein [Actinosynnema sp. NPDC020468]|uniref:VOC family protein n=1 Tax=Actinosynnema sp. NPDC020468 TaxID=3154488 RepID=UPI00340C5214